MKKNQIINGLVASMLSFPINILHRELLKLDRNRYFKVLNLLTQDKFVDLVRYDFNHTKFSSLWNNNSLNHGIKKDLLDKLDPYLLINIASKSSGNIVSAWRKWDGDNKLSNENNLVCYDLSTYLFNSSVERVAEVINFLIGSCKDVKAPDEEKGLDIFIYKKREEFPFEVIHMFSVIHPSVLFPALNLVSSEYIEESFWLIEKFLDGNERLENIFQDQYDKDYYFDEERFSCVWKHIGALKDEYLFRFLREFSEDNQHTALSLIGKERIVMAHKNGISLNGYPLPEKWNLFPDKNSNEGILEKLKKGNNKIIKKLSFQKKLELLGSLV